MKTFHFVNRLEKTGLLRKLTMDPNNTIARRGLFRMYKIPPNIKFNGISDLFKTVKSIIEKKTNTKLEVVDFVKNNNRSSFHIVKDKSIELKIPKLRSIKIKSASVRNETSTIQIRRKIITTCSTDIQGRHGDVSNFMRLVGEYTLEILKLSSKYPDVLTNNNEFAPELLKENGCKKLLMSHQEDDPSALIYYSIVNRFNVYHISDSNIERLAIPIRKTVSIDGHSMTPVMLNWDNLWCTPQSTGYSSNPISIAKAVTDAVLNLPNVGKIGKVSNIRQSFFRACVFIEQKLLIKYNVLPINATNDWHISWIGIDDLTPSIENIAYRLQNNENAFKRNSQGDEASEKYKKIAETAVKALK